MSQQFVVLLQLLNLDIFVAALSLERLHSLLPLLPLFPLAEHLFAMLLSTHTANQLHASQFHHLRPHDTFP